MNLNRTNKPDKKKPVNGGYSIRYKGTLNDMNLIEFDDNQTPEIYKLKDPKEFDQYLDRIVLKDGTINFYEIEDD